VEDVALKLGGVIAERAAKYWLSRRKATAAREAS
jgi:hypothetical protein